MLVLHQVGRTFKAYSTKDAFGGNNGAYSSASIAMSTGATTTGPHATHPLAIYQNLEGSGGYRWEGWARGHWWYSGGEVPERRGGGLCAT